MKIIKVLVDELPDSCGICCFLSDYANEYCVVMENKPIPKNIDRPDWCPLKVDDE